MALSDPQRPTRQEFEIKRDQLTQYFSSLPVSTAVRLNKKTSNLFRHRERTHAAQLDASNFVGVIEVDPTTQTCDVLGMTTYEELVDATLEHGLMPCVVPQLKTITIGGAISGIGIESSSFKNGFPHETVIEMEILTGEGRVVIARPDNEHRDLFFGFPNSYGTLGYALRIKIALEPVKPFVQLRHLRFETVDTYFAALKQICEARSYETHDVDFVDGTIFAADELYITLGTFVSSAPHLSNYTGNSIYYRSIQKLSVDYLTTNDYIWRWDTDWFWCSRSLGVQNPLIRRLIPRRYRRSDTYWKIRSFDGRHQISNRLRSALRMARTESVIQDVEIPIGQAASFFDFLDQNISLKPIWVCPVAQHDPLTTWTLYPLETQELYVNFGFWGPVPLGINDDASVHNRMIEDKVQSVDGRKSLYSDCYYDKDVFWRLYDHRSYDRLKTTYDPQHRLLDLYEKTVLRK